MSGRVAAFAELVAPRCKQGSLIAINTATHQIEAAPFADDYDGYIETNGRIVVWTTQAPRNGAPCAKFLQCSGAGRIVAMRVATGRIFDISELGIIVFRSEGELRKVVAFDTLLDEAGDWFVREMRLYWKRVLKRVDMTSRSLFALIEPGAALAGRSPNWSLRPTAPDVCRCPGRRQPAGGGPGAVVAEFRRLSDG